MLDDLVGDLPARLPRFEGLGMEKSWEREGLAALLVTVYALVGSSVVSEPQREMFRYLTRALSQLASFGPGRARAGSSGHGHSGFEQQASFDSEMRCHELLGRLVPVATEASVHHVRLQGSDERQLERGYEDDEPSVCGSGPVTSRFEREASWDSGIWCGELEPTTTAASVPNVVVQAERKRKRGFGYEEDDAFVSGDVDGSMDNIDPRLRGCESATPVVIDVEDVELQGAEKARLFEEDEEFHDILTQWGNVEKFL